MQQFCSKKGVQKEKKAARTEINNKYTETRHQRSNITATNNKKQTGKQRKLFISLRIKQQLNRNASSASNDNSNRKKYCNSK